MDSFINESFQYAVERLLAFLPKLFMAIGILLAGLVAGWLTKVVLARLLTWISLDTLAERGGLSGLLAKGGVREPPSLLLGRIAGGTVAFCFLLIAFGHLDLKVLDHLIERMFAYLPNVIIAILILILGYMLGNFLGRAALIASVNAGIMWSRLIGRFVRGLTFTLTILIALEQLGIGKETLLLAFAILFSGMVLALAIAFGFGGRDLAKEFLERKFRDRPGDDDIRHL